MTGEKARRGGPTRRVGDLVPGALRQLGVPSRPVTRRVVAAWEAGTESAWRGRAAPTRLQGGNLFVAVDSTPLRHELTQFHGPRLLSMLQALLPEDSLVALRFVAGRGTGAGGPR